ncbi:Oidioi.mRNA.OKI2018_I69.chr1.g1468.t1.cds [Oikopleura dioica]|uniref:Oidioi.mRNA.OKI2018_I69.chr1.g1468.t1.cds n=1 Tax=Oikopleura dioica TaxID=34765 RepID=A0ABN7SRJ2_OIKDI|nr:Oidioi.mRNA.OKI2018_I69.chr1.g1468.t1.cds [Oikopleura dioica]
MDMAVKKSMFNLLSLFFLFVLFGNIIFDIILKLPYDLDYNYYYDGGYLAKPPLYGLKITIVVIYFILFIMNLVTLIMQTCCIWNKNDRNLV